MKKYLLILSVVVLFASFAGAEDSESLDLNAGQQISQKTEGPKKVGYHIYVPGNYTKSSRLPLLVTFSPGGGGRGMMNTFKAAGEKFGWIVVGCDQLKNGLDRKDATPIEDEVMDEILRRIPHSRLYLGGFSGGGMRCFTISRRRNDPINGIISLGGWMGGAKYYDDDYPKGMYVAIINGDQDKNANCWVKNDTAALRKHDAIVKYFTFPGKHQAAPAGTIEKAVNWIEEPIQKEKVERLSNAYKSKKYAEAYNLAEKFASQEPGNSPQCIMAKELRGVLLKKGKVQSEKLLAAKSIRISKVTKFVNDWGKTNPLTKNARDFINKKGAEQAETLLAQEPLGRKAFRKYLLIWKGYPCAEPIAEGFNKMGEDVLKALQKKKAGKKKLKSFVKYWQSYPCTAKVVEELNSDGEKELEKLLAKSKPSASLLMVFTKKWHGYPVNKKAWKALSEMAGKKLNEIAQISRKSSRKSKLSSFIRKYKGTPAAEKAQKMLTKLKQK